MRSYQTVVSTSQSLVKIRTPLVWNGETLSRWLMEHVRVISSGQDIDPSADLFAQGFDRRVAIRRFTYVFSSYAPFHHSLSVTYLRNQLVGALRDSPEPKVRNVATRIPANIVFENPSINFLSARVSALINQDDIFPNLDHMRQYEAAIDAMIYKYSTDLLGNANGIVANGVIGHETLSSGAVVLLTGTTGGLGSFLLAQLLENPVVERVYALNRPSTSASIAERQRSAFVDKTLPANLLDAEKLVYIEADASQDNCGLASSVYDEVGSVAISEHLHGFAYELP